MNGAQLEVADDPVEVLVVDRLISLLRIDGSAMLNSSRAQADMVIVLHQCCNNHAIAPRVLGFVKSLIDNLQIWSTVADFCSPETCGAPGDFSYPMQEQSPF